MHNTKIRTFRVCWTNAVTNKNHNRLFKAWDIWDAREQFKTCLANTGLVVKFVRTHQVMA